MIVTPRDVSVADLQLVESPPRAPGHHVSSLIRVICRQLEPERFSEGAMNYERIELGFMIEHVIEEAWRQRQVNVMRPGSFTVDGISGAPDGVTFDQDTLVVDEIKCTWMSSRGCPEDKKFLHWIWQIKAYCYMLDTLRARLHVFFVNGDYREHREPQLKSWELQFHRGELEENWAMLVNQARALDATENK